MKKTGLKISFDGQIDWKKDVSCSCGKKITRETLKKHRDHVLMFEEKK